MGPNGFTASTHIAPPYEGSGVFKAGCLSFPAPSQSKLPLSIIKPPIEFP